MNLNLRTILVLVFLITSLSLIFQEWQVLISLHLFTYILLLFVNPGKNRFKRIFHRLKHISKIIFTIFIFQILFRRGGDILLHFSFLQVTTLGIEYAVVSSLRILLIIMIAGLLFDLPYSSYLTALRAWKIPYEISFIIASIIHFIPLFTDQIKIKKEALLLREIDPQKLSFIKRFQVYQVLIFPVLITAISKVKQRAISLEIRGFRLHSDRTNLHEEKLTIKDLVIQVLSIVLFLGYLVYNFKL